MYLAVHPLRRMIAGGESDVLDFKKTITNLPKIAKTIVAFANTHGGRLLIGVNDNGEITGISGEEERFMIEKACALYCKPRAAIRFEEHHYHGKTVLEVIVAESSVKPLAALGEDGMSWVYVRIADKSVLASPILVEILKRGAKDEATRITYGENEERLMAHLRTNESITHNQLCNLLNISRQRAARILAGMVSAGVVLHHFDHNAEMFRLA
jgi:predicted HTH transcriptional regulator